MSAIHRSFLFSAIERYGSLAVFLIYTAILSRLLTPAEFGIYAVINAVVAIITASFQEIGGANYLIQKETLSEKNIQTAFTITFLISISVGSLLFFSSEAFVWFFKQDELKAGITASALNFVTTPFVVVVSALFRRDLEFGKLAACNLAANLASSVVAIVLAIWKFSFMAPIWGGVAGNVVAMALLIGLYRNRRIFRPTLSEYRDVLWFGLYSGGVSLINVFYNLAPQVFLARILDFTAVGLYSRALGITQVFDKLVGQVLSSVMMPAIFAQTRAGVDLKKIYLHAISSLAVLQWPFLSLLAIIAQPVILLWLGPTWLEIVPLVRLLCIANLALFAACLTYPVLVAVGSIRDSLISSLISLPPSLLVIFIASFFGVTAVAASALLTLPFQATVAIYFIGRHLDLRLSEMMRALSKGVIVTAFTSIGTFVVAVFAQNNSLRPFTELVLACLGAAVCWLLGMALTKHPLLLQLWSVAGDNLYRLPGMPRRAPSNKTAIL